MDVSKTVFNVSQSLITVTNDGSYYYFFLNGWYRVKKKMKTQIKKCDSNRPQTAFPHT